jgi:hypothetical protein
MINTAELVRIIQEAFRDVKLDDGVSLNMTEYYDSGGSAKHFEQLAKDDERDDWQKIDDKMLEAFTVTFSFTDWKGFRFYLPAYMIWTVKYPERPSIIGDSTVFSLDPGSILALKGRPVDEILNKQQIEAAVLFLEYCAEDSDHRDTKVVARRLKKMRKYLQP